MFKKTDRKVIHKLAFQSFKAKRLRNIVTISAIILTTSLFSALFTIAMSMNKGMQEANFRMLGGSAHATFKNITRAELYTLKDHPSINKYGIRRTLGIPTQAPFNKHRAEISYVDQNQSKWIFAEPTTGSLPQEGSLELATDKKVISLLGVEPILGTRFSLTFDVEGTGIEVTEDFTLSGFWEHDEAFGVSHIFLPKSRINSILNDLNDIEKVDTDKWNLDLMFSSSFNITEKLEKILLESGYQPYDPQKENYIATGVNWGYTSAQLLSNLDLGLVLLAVLIILLIAFTGYLVIHNVLQISITNEIRFYGLLKAIGTSSRQIKRIIRKEVLLLSGIGIPIGLFLGYFLGVKISPMVLRQLQGISPTVSSASPMIFIGSALFALITVLLSSSKPGKMAMSITPIEAVRYTDVDIKNSKKDYKIKRFSSLNMALSNLRRTRGKTLLAIISLALPIILLNITVMLSNSFDLEKMTTKKISADFIIATNGYFSVSQKWQEGISDESISFIQEQGNLVTEGRTFGHVERYYTFVSEARYLNSKYRGEQGQIKQAIGNSDDKVLDNVQLYGMDDFVLDKLLILDGDLEKLKKPANYIAAVYSTDDYGRVYADSNWAQVGDLVTIRYVDQVEYRDIITDEVYHDSIPSNVEYRSNIKSYKDLDYEVVATVTIPTSLSYRFFGADQFVLGAEKFIADSGTNSVMYYTFDTADNHRSDMESFLAQYTSEIRPDYGYESRETLLKEFKVFKNVFLILGMILSFIIGLIGILNFINVVLTSIIARRREFAILRAIGMTEKQLKSTLTWEGIAYTVTSIPLSIAFILLSTTLLKSTLNTSIWFFTYNFTITPIILILPFMLLLAFIVPNVGYKKLMIKSVVEILQQVE